MGPSDSIRELAEPVAATFGLELWDVEVAGPIVRILVDRPQGIDIDALADASHALSNALDERDDLAPAGRYTLEVSSPGVERPLRTTAHYRQYVGSEVAIKLRTPLDGSRRLRGTLIEASESGVRLGLEGATPAGPGTELTYDQIERAHTVLTWGPAPKPGRPQPRRRVATNARVPAADTRPVPPRGSETNPKDPS